MIIGLVAFANNLFGQQTDSVFIKGQVFDERNEPVLGAMVRLTAKKEISAAVTDHNGRFTLLILPSVAVTGPFIEVSYTGYLKSRTPIKLKEIKSNYLIYLEIDKNFIFCDNPVYYRIPLIDPDNPGSTTTFSGYQIKAMGR